MTDDEIKAELVAVEARARDYTNTATAKYVKADSWWQAYRREHYLAVQNILIFGVVPVVLLIGVLIGKAIK